MESNGKSVSRDGSPLDIATTPVVWGAAGTASLFSGIASGKRYCATRHHGPTCTAGISLAGDWAQNHKILVANALAQAEALAVGSPNSKGHIDILPVEGHQPD